MRIHKKGQMKKIIGIVLGICYSTLVWAQSVEQIKADRSTYLWGEGKGNTLKKADSEALSDLINQDYDHDRK